MESITLAIGLASQFLPGALRWLTGDDKSKAAAVAETVLGVAQQVTGKADPASAIDAIRGNPELAAKLQLAMLDHERAWWREETQRLELDVRDRDSARARELAARDHTTKVLAIVVVTGFCASAYAVLAGLVEGLKDPITAALVGTVIGNISAFATQVLNYYLGSSQGSARKDMIAATRAAPGR